MREKRGKRRDCLGTRDWGPRSRDAGYQNRRETFAVHSSIHPRTGDQPGSWKLMGKIVVGRGSCMEEDHDEHGSTMSEGREKIRGGNGDSGNPTKIETK
jgi:hypothetical protein